MKIFKRFMDVALFVGLFAAPLLGLSEEGKGKKRGEHFREEKLQDKKDHILQRLNEEKGHLETTIACVKAAQNREALEACRPKGGRHGGERGGAMGKMQTRRNGRPENGERDDGPPPPPPPGALPPAGPPVMTDGPDTADGPRK